MDVFEGIRDDTSIKTHQEKQAVSGVNRFHQSEAKPVLLDHLIDRSRSLNTGPSAVELCFTIGFVSCCPSMAWE